MNKEQWNDLIAKLKSPAAILAAVIAAGLLINIYILIFVVVPPAKQQFSLLVQLNQAERERAQAQQKPIPPKVTEEEIEKTLYQIPLKAEVPRLMLSLREMEREIGLTIDSIEFQEKSTAVAEQLLNDNGQIHVPTSNTAGVGNEQGQSGQPAAGSGQEQQSLVMESKFTLGVSGTYPQVLAFLQKLQQSDRLLAVQSWSWSAGSNKTAAGGASPAPQAAASDASPAAGQADSPVKLQLTCSYYYAPALNGKLQDLSPLPVGSSSQRTNPTVTDEQYFQLLQEMGSTSLVP